MKKWNISAGLVAIFLATGSAQAAPYLQEFESGSMDWSTGAMEAIGIGVPPERYIGSARARPMAVRAARVDALRNLLEQTQGVKVESQTLSKDFAIESDLVRATMKGAVRGATMVGRPHYMEDGSVEVTMRINYREKVAPVVVSAFLGTKEVSKAPVSLDTAVPAAKAEATNISGLIIDAVGLGLRTALAPQILDESGNVIYSGSIVATEKQGDMVAYDTSPVDAAKLDRVGGSPLTIKAVKVLGLTNVVISDADAEKLSNQRGLHEVLRNAKVVFAL